MILRSLMVSVAMVGVSFASVDAAENAGECGLQETPEETWNSWQEAYVSGEWKKWFDCHSQGAQAGLFLSAAISTPESEGKTRVIEKYGRCGSRSRASLECVNQETMADFFYEMTILDEESSRSRLMRIWNKDGVSVHDARLISVEQHDDDNVIGKIQSSRADGKMENWMIRFVRVDGRWFVTFNWGM